MKQTKKKQNILIHKPKRNNYVKMLALNCFFPYLVMRMDFKVLNICTRRLFGLLFCCYVFFYLSFYLRFETLLQKAEKKMRGKFQNIKTAATTNPNCAQKMTRRV